MSCDTRLRAEIIYYAFHFSASLSCKDISELTGVSTQTVSKHVLRFDQSIEALETLIGGDHAKLESTVVDCLEDAPRSGRPPTFTPLQIVSVISIACEKPSDSGRPVSHWTPREIAAEAVKRNIVATISVSHVSRILNRVNLKPHKNKGWCFTTEKDAQLFAQQAEAVCDVYLEASHAYAQQGVHSVSVDEATGIQANEKRAPTLAPEPDRVGKEETQYTRHGALCLIAAWHVAIGKIIHYTIQEKRTNIDFLNFITQMLRCDWEGRWVIVVDNLNIHCSEEMVQFVAKLVGFKGSLGSKKKRQGILASMKSRKEFLSCQSHRVRFVFTPKHSSWLNQIEVIFGITKRRSLNGARFRSQAELVERLSQFIEYFNETFARPMNWTYTGRPIEEEQMSKPLTWRQKLKPKGYKEQWQEHKKSLAA